jgi:hypothetical protein
MRPDIAPGSTFPDYELPDLEHAPQAQSVEQALRSETAAVLEEEER